jgi:hypothetical protein
MEYTLFSLLIALVPLRNVLYKSSGNSMSASATFIEENLFAAEIIILRRP